MAKAAKTGGKSDPTTADLHAQLQTLKADIVALGEAFRAFVQSRGEDLTQVAEDETRYLRAKRGKSPRQAQAAEAMAFRRAEDTLRRNPSLAIGLAAAVGLLVGLQMSRR